jgi:phage antirepressor YoqD-like protein
MCQNSLSVINESGLYSLIFRSNKPEAKAFRKWVTSEVLPQIRKTGSYSVPANPHEQILLLCQKLTEQTTALIAAESKLVEQQPKVALADQCLIAVNSRSMGDTAKVLGVGRNTLFQILRDEGMLMQTNIPYQKYISIGWFEVKITPKVQHDVTVNYPVTMVLPKGLDKIRGILNRKEAT